MTVVISVPIGGGSRSRHSHGHCERRYQSYSCSFSLLIQLPAVAQPRLPRLRPSHGDTRPSTMAVAMHAVMVVGMIRPIKKRFAWRTYLSSRRD
jgi:hypothetical protein